MDQERANIRARMRETLLDMSYAERTSNDAELLALAEGLLRDAKALKKHVEDNGV